MMHRDEWIEVSTRYPPRGIEIETKIDNADGVRNIQSLVYGISGTNLWWMPDKSMYVYYCPTHWRPLQR